MSEHDMAGGTDKAGHEHTNGAGRLSIARRIGVVGTVLLVLGLGAGNFALLSQQRHAVTDAVKLFADENARLTRQNSQLVLQLNVAKREKEVAEQALALAQTIAEQRGKALVGFSGRLAKRTARNAARNVGSVPGETIPFVGTAIMVGLTAWDVYDACETMKELNTLNAAFGHASEDQDSICGMKVPTASEAMGRVRQDWRSVYAEAAALLNQPGKITVPLSMPQVSWPVVMKTMCPMLGSFPNMCGRQ